MQKIVPHLWYAEDAIEAATLYAGAIDDSQILSISSLEGTPSGKVDVVSLELAGLRFQLISAGPYFRFTPAVSFSVSCHSREEADRIWRMVGKRSKESQALEAAPLTGDLDFVEDPYGLSWRILGGAESAQEGRITPTLLFSGDRCGAAEDAIRTWTGLFSGASIDELVQRQDTQDSPGRAGSILRASFHLGDIRFVAMASAVALPCSFNEAISFMVYCDTQEEIDHYWNGLSAVREAEQCGWLKDRYGVSWQIIPRLLDELMAESNTETRERVTQAFLRMKKFDIQVLKKAASRA